MAAPEGRYVSRESAKQRIGKLVRPYWRSVGSYSGFSDSRYYAPTQAELEQFVQEHPIDVAALGELFDCDDYAFVMKGSVCIFARGGDLELAAPLCFGIAWGRFAWRGLGVELHACNWALDSAGRVWWVEPQNGVIYSLEQCRPGLELLLA